MLKSEKFKVPESSDHSEILNAIPENLKLQFEAPFKETVTYYDTFDWLLETKGLRLSAQKNIYSILKPGQNSKSEVSWRAQKPPAFWQDFPEGPAQNAVRQSLDIRAVYKQAALVRNVHPARLLNADEKTVLRLKLEEIKVIAGRKHLPVTRTFRVTPIRGYPKPAAQIRAIFRQFGLKPLKEDAYLAALALLDKKPGEYTSKVSVQLSPEMTGAEAMQRLVYYLIDVMQQNEQGLISDIDTEFLHDFRVSIRRIRSGLALIKGVFTPETTQRLKTDFAYLGKSTNRLRDLDVYLLAEEEYKSMLPPAMGEGLDPLFDALKEEREIELKRLIRTLRSKRYQSILATARESIRDNAEKSHPAAPNADKPVTLLAKRFIRKRYHVVLKKGGAIDDETPDQALHDLRIDCKKLRYLLEFFTSLFPKKQMILFVKQLKVLQDNLGDFNDLFVQQEELKRFMTEIAPKSKNPEALSAALGGLITLLHRRQGEVRHEFSQRFSTFTSAENAARFENLFGKKKTRRNRT